MTKSPNGGFEDVLCFKSALLNKVYQRVAVKMLKPQHSSGELQDLITEYTRLKEVWL